MLILICNLTRGVAGYFMQWAVVQRQGDGYLYISSVQRQGEEIQRQRMLRKLGAAATHVAATHASAFDTSITHLLFIDYYVLSLTSGSPGSMLILICNLTRGVAGYFMPWVLIDNSMHGIECFCFCFC